MLLRFFLTSNMINNDSLSLQTIVSRAIISNALHYEVNKEADYES